MIFNSPLRLVDTHCHLNLEEFDADRTQVIERALKNGIDRILIPGLTVQSIKTSIELSRRYPDIFLAIGVHPNSGATWEKGSISDLKQLAGEVKSVAVGEIGLDYYRDYTSRALQRDMFLQQLTLAAELGLPVIVHNRDATRDVTAILRDWYLGLVKAGVHRAQNPGVLHSFSGSLDEALTIIEMSFRIGITGPVTFKNASQLQSVVTQVPLESLLIETDAPYLTPRPFRGQRNEPANVRIVAEKIAEIKQIPFELVARVTTTSADQLFDWRVVH